MGNANRVAVLLLRSPLQRLFCTGQERKVVVGYFRAEE